MLWKCCTQYASKFGKLSSGRRTAKGQFSFQSQRKAMPKNAQTTAQLHSSHTLVKWYSKFSKPGFSTTWTANFQMFKLVLEVLEAEGPEIKNTKMKWSEVKSHHSVVSDSLWPHGRYPTRFLRPWDSLGKNTGVDCHFLLQGIFPNQGSNPGLPHWRQTL